VELHVDYVVIVQAMSASGRRNMSGRALVEKIHQLRQFN
jgi:hypothetical protein